MRSINQITSFKGNIYAVMYARLLVLLLLLSVSRMMMYFFNPQLFTGINVFQLFLIWFYGLRFDVVSLSILASFFVLGNSLPFGFRRNKTFQKILNYLVLISSSIALILNMVDVVYYRFTLKRLTADIFNYVANNGAFTEVFPSFIMDFWQVSLVSIILVLFMWFSFYRLGLNRKIEKTSWRFYTWQSLLFLLSMSILLIGIRGGFQLKPINIIDANKKVASSLSPLVLNTPFTMIKSVGQNAFQEKNYYTSHELEAIFNPIRSYTKREATPRNIKNVVVIVLESFSAEHIGFFTQGKSFTPFLDSLFTKSLCVRAIANGKRSIEGIPAVLSSLPTLSNASFLNGPYAANQIEGLANTLVQHNYKTAFFHGGKNGTMSFDAYAYKAGFQSYYGLNEYLNKEDYDGHWGIWDEEYLAYFGAQLNDFKEPFLASVFTLSSHHPYQIPEKYKDQLPSGKLPIQKAIAYTDLALKHFFKQIEKQAWYPNTIFVITADHTSEGASLAAKNSLGQFSIPLAFFAPADSGLKKVILQRPVQQLDVYPSLLQYLGISDTIVAFGNSIFESHNAFAINFYNQKIQVFDSDQMLIIQDDIALGLYDYRTDSLLKVNKLPADMNIPLQDFQKAFIQQYNNRMISNGLKNN